MRVMVNGIHVNYEISGKEGAPVVMLSHSLGSDMSMWNPQTRPLRRHYRILLYDTRGHGGSDAPKGAYTLEQLGEDALGLLDALSFDAVHWVGLSMGGMIGQYMALNHSDRIRKLALCDTAAAIAPETQPVWEERLQMVRKGGMQALVDSTLERWFTPPYLSQSRPEVELIREHFLSTPVSGYIGCTEAIRRLDYLERLSEIRLPTLIMVGEEDQGTPVSASRAMHERIPDSRLVVLPSAAHLSNIEQAGAFNEALMEFLGEH